MANSRQSIYSYLPAPVRRALRPAYYRMRAVEESIKLFRLWRNRHRPQGTRFFPWLREYALSTPRYLSKTRDKKSGASRRLIAIPDETYFEPPPPADSAFNPLVHLVAPFNPPLFAAQLYNVRVIGDAGDVATSGDVLLADLSFRRPTMLWNELGEHRELERVPEARRLEGQYALLTSLYAGANYFHWVFNALPRLALLERAGIKPAQLDGLLLNTVELPAINEMLARLDISPALLVEMGLRTALQVESLWVTPSLLTTGHRRRSICSWLRAHFLSEQAAKLARRLYISRADAVERRMTNEDELVDMLAPLGFEKIVIGQCSVAEQAALFAQAAVVVAPHGSALANLVFCAPGTCVIELMRQDRLRPYYWELSACMGLNYYCAMSKLDPMPVPSRLGGNDTVMPPDVFRAVLKAADL